MAPELGERVATCETNISNIKETLDKLSGSYSKFKDDMFGKIDTVTDKLARIEAKLDTKKEDEREEWDKEKHYMNVRTSWIVIIMGVIYFTIDHFKQIITYFGR